MAYAEKFNALSYDLQAEVLDFIDFLVARSSNRDVNGFSLSDANDLKRRIADIDAGNGKVHELIVA